LALIGFAFLDCKPLICFHISLQYIYLRPVRTGGKLGLFSQITHEQTWRGFASLSRNQTIEGRLLQIPRMFFTSAFLFTRPKVPFAKKPHNLL